MKNQIDIKNVANGVKVSIKGDVKFSDVKSMVDSCDAGECNCSCDMDAIESIGVSGADGEVSINIAGSSLDANDISNCMNGCECDF